MVLLSTFWKICSLTAMPRTEPGQTLATVIGKNARRLRTQAGLTLDQVAVAARQRGLKWSESRVADFEAGKVAPSLATLIGLCLALADIGCKATLPALVASEQPVQVSESLLVYEDDLLMLLTGRRRPASPGPSGGGGPNAMARPSGHGTTPKWRGETLLAENAPSPETPDLLASSGATEARVRKSLNISPDRLAQLSIALWGRSFSEERDRRARRGANAQARGQVSRRMLTELATAIGQSDENQ